MDRNTRDIVLAAISLLMLAIVVIVIGFFDKDKKQEPKQEPEQMPEIIVADTPIEMPIEEEEPQTLSVSATAYCPCRECSDGWGRQTATGATATEGRTIAVDPSVIPYGTEVVIDGKTYLAEDTGAAINGNEIDIFFDDHESTVAFGRQTKQIQLK